MNFKMLLLTTLLIPAFSLCMEKEQDTQIAHKNHAVIINSSNRNIQMKARNAQNSHYITIKWPSNGSKQVSAVEDLFTIIPPKSQVTIPFLPVYFTTIHDLNTAKNRILCQYTILKIKEHGHVQYVDASPQKTPPENLSDFIECEIEQCLLPKK
jgi:hypothetical protein